jgi:hypothetical protein
MAEILRQVQALLFTAASTVHIWRDAAIACLAGVVILCLWLWFEAQA